MIKHAFYLPEYDWRVRLFVNFSCEHTNVILQELENVDCETDYIRKAYDNMQNCTLNTGLTYTSLRYRTSIAVVYKTSSLKEFINTLSHECAHICAHITKSTAIKITEEEFCGLMGNVMAETTPIIVNIVNN